MSFILLNFTAMNKYEPIGHLRYKTSVKEQAFERIVLGLIDWWIEANPDKPFEQNDLGELKIMKLLFFVVAGSAIQHNEGLLNIFTFHAQPYGHVELDIQELIRYRQGKFKLFTITTKQLILSDQLQQTDPNPLARK